MNGWWVTNVLQSQGPVVLAAWIFWVIFSIVLHELAHGWAALKCGDSTPVESGHWTFNPVVHMGVFSLIMFALVGIAWGAMPVNPSRFRGRHDDALVSLAGPLMNVLLAALCIVGFVVFLLARGFGMPASSPDLARGVLAVLDIGAFLNLSLALFNLLPVPPLDGSRIVASFVPAYRRILSTEVGRALAIILIVVMMSRAGAYVFGAGRWLTDQAIGRSLVVLGYTPGPAQSPSTP